MSKKALEQLSETMFYVLMAFRHGDFCGAEVTTWVYERTKGRVRIGPGTLYTLLAQFESVGAIHPAEQQGRKKHYRITSKGETLYLEELTRLRQCVADAEEKP